MKPFNIVRIAGSLYLSNKVWLERDLEVLSRYGIGAIVNLAEDHAYDVPPPMVCIHCSFPDGIHVPVDDLAKIYSFIDLQRQRTRVLVHCSAGVSRSAGIVVGQLMRENRGLTWEEALQIVNAKRAVWVAVEMRESVLSFLAHETNPSPLSEIQRNDTEMLQQLQDTCGVRLQEVRRIGLDTQGFVIEDGRVVGLGLYGLKLASFPDEIRRFSLLQDLCLSNNQLEILPAYVTEFVHLRKLNLSSNRLASLPAEIGDMESLRVLNVARNQLKTLPGRIQNSHDLNRLYLHENCLASLPEGFSRLGSLTELYLQNNQLVCLPDDLGNLSRLQRLAVNGNTIGALPESICRLSQLIALNLAQNHLAVLPPSLGTLTEMDNLNISSNCLEELPNAITTLKKLRRLNIGLNRFVVLPLPIERWLEELAGGGTIVIR